MKERYSDSDIDKIKTKTIFFDANILIYLFWPVIGRDEPELYATIFRDLIDNDLKFVVSPVVISEVINRELRLEFSTYNNKTHTYNKKEFKKFRDSEYGQKIQEDILAIIRGKILPLFTIVDSKYDNEKLEKILYVDSIDFNDKMIVDICIENGYILLTNDKDFKESEVDILSINPELKGNE